MNITISFELRNVLKWILLSLTFLPLVTASTHHKSKQLRTSRTIAPTKRESLKIAVEPEGIDVKLFFENYAGATGF